MRNKNTVTKYIGIFHCKNWPIKRCQSYRKLFDFLIIHIAETNVSARLAQLVEHETIKLGVVGSSTTLGYTFSPIIEWIYLILGQNTPLDKTFLLTYLSWALVNIDL